ncbi:MAG: SRPBCC family protein [Actinomycetota bacterium]|nr:SRPBCC family protein [Actinomycetota bacterium]
MTVEESIVIAAPPEDVFAVVADLERAPEWQRSLESVDVERGIEVRRLGGRRQEARFNVAESDPPRRLVIESHGGSARARAAMTLEPQGDGTRLAFSLDLQLSGAARFGAGMIRGSVEREARDNLATLKRLVESERGA